MKTIRIAGIHSFLQHVIIGHVTPSSHENDHRTTCPQPRIHAAHTYNYMRTNSVYLMPDVIAQPTEHSIDVNRRSSPVWTITLTTLPQNGSQTIYGMKITTNFVHGPSK